MAPGGRRLRARRGRRLRRRRPCRRPADRGRAGVGRVGRQRSHAGPLLRAGGLAGDLPPRSTRPWTRPGVSAPSSCDGVALPAAARMGEADAGSDLREILDRAAVALAAEQVGGAQRCLDMAVAYAKEREQFGRPIGSFQAIKHKCADMMIDLESARSAAYYAACVAAECPYGAVGRERTELAQVASLAKAYCSDAFFRCAADCIQIHGGVGFTWEYDVHLFFKRARSSEVLLGDPSLAPRAPGAGDRPLTASARHRPSGPVGPGRDRDRRPARRRPGHLPALPGGRRRRRDVRPARRRRARGGGRSTGRVRGGRPEADSRRSSTWSTSRPDASVVWTCS